MAWITRWHRLPCHWEPPSRGWHRHYAGRGNGVYRSGLRSGSEPTEYLAVIAAATLASIGTAGPGVGLIAIDGATAVGLPVGIGLIIGVDRLLDMMRTVVNITGDGTVTSVVAKSEGMLDEDIFYEVSDRDEYSQGKT